MSVATNGVQEDVRRVDSALVEAGVKFAFGIAGSAVTANPLGLIQVTYVNRLQHCAVGVQVALVIMMQVFPKSVKMCLLASLASIAAWHPDIHSRAVLVECLLGISLTRLRG
jgi:hypothetical protein